MPPYQPVVSKIKECGKKVADQKLRTCASDQVLMIENFEIIEVSIFKWSLQFNQVFSPVFYKLNKFPLQWNTKVVFVANL